MGKLASWLMMKCNKIDSKEFIAILMSDFIRTVFNMKDTQVA